MTANNNQLRVKVIALNRWEGVCDDAEVNSFEEADAVLRKWARTAPSAGGYDKVGFDIIYEDGNAYRGRYDLNHSDIYYANLLGAHVVSNLTWASGRELNPRNEIEQYKKLIESRIPLEVRENAAKLLDKYEIGYKCEGLQTPGKWICDEQGNIMTPQISACSDVPKIIAKVIKGDNIEENEMTANAILIVEACNAAIAINPGNPISAVKVFDEMLLTLEGVLVRLDLEAQEKGEDAEFMLKAERGHIRDLIGRTTRPNTLL